LLFLIISIGAYFKITPQDLDKMIELLKDRSLPQITYQQFKVACLSRLIISIVFLISGWGLLLEKEWARKLTIYFSFFWIILIFIGSFLNPTLIKHLFLQIIYLGILIIYLTNKRVENYFLR